MLTDPEEDYARGFVPFLGVNVFLDSHPLIPRTETEYWTERAIHEMDNRSINRPIIQVLDLFAGSGAIGLAVLKHIPNAQVTFGDSEVRHSTSTERSIKENNLDASRAFFVTTDVWSAVSGRFDAILANPPYISKERGTAAASVTANEPPEALYAPDDGFFYIEKFLDGLAEHLTAGGVCFLEHEPFHTPRIEHKAQDCGLTTTTLHDQYGVERFSLLKHKNP